jgi:predicted DNA binding CopG/RHH family protein
MNQQINNPKKKVVTFRLTESDLERYEKYCIDEQIRISDLIREALQTKVNDCINAIPGIQFITEPETV